MLYDQCHICGGEKYLIITRDDGFDAVERCDECFGVPDDEGAAELARADGIACMNNYPCYVTGRLSNATSES